MPIHEERGGRRALIQTLRTRFHWGLARGEAVIGKAAPDNATPELRAMTTRSHGAVRPREFPGPKRERRLR